MKRIWLAGLCLFVPLAAMAELTEDTVSERISTVREWVESQVDPPSDNAIQDKLREVTSDIDVTKLGMDEITRGAVLLLEVEDLRQRLRVRLDVLARGDDGPAAEAAIMGLFLSMRGTGTGPGEQVKAVLTHPGLKEALANGKGFALLSVVEHLPAEQLEANGPAIARLIDLVPETVAAEELMALVGYAGALGELGESVSEERVAEVRARVADRFAAAVARAREAGAEDDLRMLESGLRYVTGAALRGELIGRPAPALDLEWNSAGWDLDTLGDLRGNVVVLDFWATWCGPCIASFPNLRELRAKYRSEDVVILGVTSLQGRHYASGKPPVDTRDDPAREYALMKEFMSDMEITWMVAFSRQEVFNQAFGVQGIPHLAIIAADGTVRYNGLSPHADLSELTSKIDALLAEREMRL